MKEQVKLWELYPNEWKTESAFMSWIRGGVRRSLWNRHPVKLNFIRNNRIRIPNPNPRGRVAEVWGGVCALTGEVCVADNLEVDHKVGNHSLRKLDDLQSFMEGIVVITEDDLQFVSKEAHRIKSHAEKNNMTFEEARVHKEVLKIMKEKVDKEYLSSHNLPIPTTQAKRKELIIKHKLEQLEKSNEI